MVELTNIKTRTYEYDSNYYVDIVERNDWYEAYIYDSNIGFKSFMFGMLKSEISYESFLDAVLDNIDEYIESYLNDLEILEMDYEE